MTEDEAKTKWCPFRRYVIDSETVFPTGNRFEDDALGVVAKKANNACLCIASACMAWRTTKDVYVRSSGQRSERDLYGDGRWETEGHCGLAGAPR